ncbi:MAG: hypothetical protein ACP5P1_15345 [Acidimicrobiales bacterium]
MLTDPRDVGCDEAIRLMHVYAGLLVDQGNDRTVTRHPGIAAHFRSCGPCAEDLEGLLLALRG